MTRKGAPRGLRPLEGSWRIAALVWVVAVVALYLVVRESGLSVVP